MDTHCLTLLTRRVMQDSPSEQLPHQQPASRPLAIVPPFLVPILFGRDLGQMDQLSVLDIALPFI